MLELIPELNSSLLAGCFAQIDPPAITAVEAGAATPPLQMILLVVALVSASYLLVQKGVLHSKALLAGGIAVGLLAIVIAASLLPATLAAYITFAFFVLAAAGGIAFLASREPVYAALGFTTAVLSTCGILFMQSALFVAAATMIVYAGATIIIFLFVLMFAQQTNLRPHDINLTHPIGATLIGAVMMTAIAVCVLQPGAIPDRKPDQTRLLSEAGLIISAPAIESTEVDQADQAVVAASTEEPAAVDSRDPHIPVATAELGRSLYTDYLATVELAGILLMVAAIGAIALATRTTPEVSE